MDSFKDVPAYSQVLDFGGGPTLYNLIAAAGRADHLHFSDYLDTNRWEVQKWLNEESGAFDWGETICAVLELEGGDSSEQGVAERGAAIRQKVECILACDAHLEAPLGQIDWQYDVLVTSLCIEAAARTYDEWRQCIRKVMSLLKPGGRLIMTAVKDATAYSVGNQVFPVVRILEADIINALVDVGFVEESIAIDWVPATHPVHPYEGLMFISALKSP